MRGPEGQSRDENALQREKRLGRQRGVYRQRAGGTKMMW